MKNLLLAALTTVITACGANDAPTTPLKSNIDDATTAAFSCGYVDQGPNRYSFTIEVFETKMTIRQNAINARFRDLNYGIEEDTALRVPAEAPRFACASPTRPNDGYSYEIEVFDDRVVILQSSRTARFAPRKYRLHPTN